MDSDASPEQQQQPQPNHHQQNHHQHQHNQHHHPQQRQSTSGAPQRLPLRVLQAPPNQASLPTLLYKLDSVLAECSFRCSVRAIARNSIQPYGRPNYHLPEKVCVTPLPPDDVHLYPRCHLNIQHTNVSMACELECSVDELRKLVPFNLHVHQPPMPPIVLINNIPDGARMELVHALDRILLDASRRCSIINQNREQQWGIRRVHLPSMICVDHVEEHPDRLRLTVRHFQHMSMMVEIQATVEELQAILPAGLLHIHRDDEQDTSRGTQAALLEELVNSAGSYTSIPNQEAAMCAVCHEDLKNGDKVPKIPCGHHFHVNCLVPWLRRRGTCPLCRQPVSGEETNSGGGEGSAQERETADQGGGLFGMLRRAIQPWQNLGGFGSIE
eukprot:m.218684 g.218684  ORF g.218684 m.218684 type:complete len:385 (+) comp15905_c1_seq4:264-1418(+)